MRVAAVRTQRHNARALPECTCHEGERKFAEHLHAVTQLKLYLRPFLFAAVRKRILGGVVEIDLRPRRCEELLD